MDKHSFDHLAGKLLEKKRRQQLKTQGEIEETAELGDKYLGKIGNGNTLPNMYTYYKLCKALGIYDELFAELDKEFENQ
ncbi:helix-turn-helix domain-containing protein [Oceanobacillus damuensis]|uniref:helix-turn-helix domain-containing protein n=1 Tax=Oceanobacillus damuensis TaxID=937928 RepID=UPI0012EEC98A|nr:helix-turn-helix transcriptional regulator [Oceanobacillus damuensis]